MSIRGLAAAAAAAGLLASAPVAYADTEIVVQGLDNPRGLEFAPGGALYIAEAGTGGGAGPLCVEGPEGPTCPGVTGAVTKVSRSGAVSKAVTGLYSTAAPDGSGAIGPADVAVLGAKNLAMTVGLGADPAYREVLASNGIDGFVGRLARKSGRSATKAAGDIAGHEAAQNPDGGEPDSNPYGVAYDTKRGVYVVADAGGNSLIEVKGTRTRTLTTFPSRPNPLPFGPPVYQSVPTGVDVGPDGAYYVGELTGFPFIAGAAHVYRVTRGGSTSEWASGFTNIVGTAAGDDGLYVVEIASNGLLNGPIGSVWFVPWDEPGGKTLVVGGLFAPGGAAVSPDGDLYVTIGSVVPGGGQVIRIDR
jgi:hypothetical protein